MARTGFGLAGLLAIAMTAACSASDDPPATAGDSATLDTAIDDAPKSDSASTDSLATDSLTTDSAKTDAPTEAGACGIAAPGCNTITMPASATLVTGTVGTLPTFTAGGTIPDGSYVLVKEVLESGTPRPSKQVAVVTGNCLEGLSIDDTGKEVRATGTGSFETGEFSFICPITFTQHSSYGRKDATGGKLTLITVSDPALGPRTYREWIQQ
ncbi:MAG: hypothetical protein ABI175_21675 [Polyangiales bacterium]